MKTYLEIAKQAIKAGAGAQLDRADYPRVECSKEIQRGAHQLPARGVPGHERNEETSDDSVTCTATEAYPASVFTVKPTPVYEETLPGALAERPPLTRQEVLEATAAWVVSRRERRPLPETTAAAIERATSQYYSERLVALLSLDEHRISAFLRRWGMRWPGATFWAHVHRMRTWKLVGLPEEEREKSRRWLAHHAPIRRPVRPRQRGPWKQATFAIPGDVKE